MGLNIFWGRLKLAYSLKDERALKESARKVKREHL
jgi:hypothetical protein